eukprot:6619158-Prymnesium_polylepis.1
MVERSVRRALYGWFELGLFQDSAAAAADPRRQVPMSVVDGAPHRALAKRAAVKGVILLKNTHGALPLGGRGMAASVRRPQPKRRLRLAVIGPSANRTLTLTSNYAGCKDKPGGPILPECSFVNPLEGLAAAALASAEWDDDVLYEHGCDVDSPDTSGISAAVAAARQADVTIFVGGLITCQE